MNAENALKTLFPRVISAVPSYPPLSTSTSKKKKKRNEGNLLRSDALIVLQVGGNFVKVVAGKEPERGPDEL